MKGKGSVNLARGAAQAKALVGNDLGKASVAEWREQGEV